MKCHWEYNLAFMCETQYLKALTLMVMINQIMNVKDQTKVYLIIILFIKTK